MDATQSLLDNVEVRLMGDVLVFSSHDDFFISQAVRQVTQQGGKVIQQPTRVGNMWVATVTTPDYQDTHAEVAPLVRTP